MAFINRLTIESPPLRVYMHECGQELWGEKSEDIATRLRGDLGAIIPERISTEDYQFFTALLWGDKSDRMLDLFGYSGLQNWASNPGIDSWVLKNGIIVPSNGKSIEVTCGEGLVILGREEELRRTTDSLSDYLRVYPEIGLPFYRSQ